MAGMTESTWITWRDSLYFLRSLSAVPAALANATTLLAATPQWSQRLVARTSVHDLLFTLPGDDYPFRSQVRVQWAAGTSTILRWQDDALAEETNAEADNVDRVLDAVLERLATTALICRRCHRLVVISADQYEVFERMHYSCFHYEFEHDPFDPDEECTAGGCPAQSIHPHPERRPASWIDSDHQSLASGWIWTRKLRDLLELVSHYIGYDFDDSDWAAIDPTNRPRGDAIIYPLGKQPRQLSVRIDTNDEGDETTVEFAGPPGPDLGTRIETLIEAFCQPNSH